jgi:hypothetical protein
VHQGELCSRTFLVVLQDRWIYGLRSLYCTFQNKSDVASLVERHLGFLYPNFPRVRPILVRQARDLLVCTFHGNLARFEREFCIPATELLRAVRNIADRKVCAKDKALYNRVLLISRQMCNPLYSVVLLRSRKVCYIKCIIQCVPIKS